MSDLAELLERVKAAAGPDRELGCQICLALNYMPYIDEPPMNLRRAEYSEGWLDYEVVENGKMVDCTDDTPCMSGSIDAALALTERVLPGWGVYFRRDKETCGAGCVFPEHFRVTPGHAEGATLPLAILAATLAALTASLSAIEVSP